MTQLLKVAREILTANLTETRELLADLGSPPTTGASTPQEKQ